MLSSPRWVIEPLDGGWVILDTFTGRVADPLDRFPPDQPIAAVIPFRLKGDAIRAVAKMNAEYRE
jgi:hypothetical protein